MYGNKLIELAEDGALAWEALARECIAYMSEDDAKDMAITAFDVESEDDEQYFYLIVFCI